MSFFDCCLEAFSSLRQNYLRTALTVLGIVIGVMSVIVMLAVGRGVQTQVTDTISSIGSNLLVVWPQMQTSNRVKRPGTGPLYADDFEGLLGKKASRNIENDKHISLDDIS